MSIYKKQRLLWEITASMGSWERVDTAIGMIYHTLRHVSKDWVSKQDIYSIFQARADWQREILDAAIRTLQSQDKVRYNPANHKIQYKPAGERT